MDGILPEDSGERISDASDVRSYLSQFNEEISRYADRAEAAALDWYDAGALSLDLALIGSGAVFLLADRWDVTAAITTDDLDLYAAAAPQQLREFGALEYGHDNDLNDHVYAYNVAPDRDAELSSCRPVIEVFTGYQPWYGDDRADEINAELDTAIADGGVDTIVDDYVTVYLPGPATLRATNPKNEDAVEVLESVEQAMMA